MVETLVIEGPGASDSWTDRADSLSRVEVLQLCFEDPETDHLLGLRWISWRGCALDKGFE